MVEPTFGLELVVVGGGGVGLGGSSGVEDKVGGFDEMVGGATLLQAKRLGSIRGISGKRGGDEMMICLVDFGSSSVHLSPVRITG